MQLSPMAQWPACLSQSPQSMCSVERVSDGRWVPAAAALGGGDAIGVESVRDRGQALAGCSLAPDSLDRVRGHGRGAAEPDALRALDGERLPGPLRDRAPLAGGEGGEQGRAR